MMARIKAGPKRPIDSAGAKRIDAPSEPNPAAVSEKPGETFTAPTPSTPTTTTADHIPVHAEVCGAPDQVVEAAAALDRIRASVADPQARALLERASAAAQRTAKLGDTKTPLRFAVKEDASRPNEIAGRLERKLVGSGEKQRLRLRFKPFDRDLAAFAVPADAVDGLRNGARLELKLKKSQGGDQQYAIKTDWYDFSPAMIANVVVEDGAAFAVKRSLAGPYEKVPIRHDDPASLAGKSVRVRVLDADKATRHAVVKEVIGGVDDPNAFFLDTASNAGASFSFPGKVIAQVEKLKARPIEGKSFEHIPFVTIDNDDSKDLDQALAFERRPDGGFVMHYAIADAAYWVDEGSPLDREAARRATSCYLPDRSLPMMPREVSEGFCSLNANVRRRAFVATIEFDKNAQQISTKFERGVIRSRAKLSYNQVQKFHDSGFKGELAGHEYSEGLKLLGEFGPLRIADAHKRGVVPSPDDGVEVRRAPGGGFLLRPDRRNEVEKWNEQVSLFVNGAVGEFLEDRGLVSLHRVHPPPGPERIEAFRSKMAALGQPWPDAMPLTEYMSAVDRSTPLGKAIQMQARKLNRAAKYSSEPGGHDAIKMKAYDHFTAPMRRYSDILVHRILAAAIEGGPIPYQDPKDRTLERAARRAEFAKFRDRVIDDRAQSYMTAKTLGESLGQTKKAVVLDVNPGGALVELEGSGIQLEVLSHILNDASNGPAMSLASDGVTLEGGAGRFRLGESVDLVVTETDPERGISRLLPPGAVAS